MPGPALGDPVVVDGTKYRIRAILSGVAELRQHFAPHATATVPLTALAYDKTAGLWRAPRPMLPAPPAELVIPDAAGDLAGTCSEHREPLVTREQYGSNRGGWGRGEGYRVAIVCPRPEHGEPYKGWYGRDRTPPVDALRCAWCGGRLYPEGTEQWDVRGRRAYDSELHRLQAFRYRRRNPSVAS
jgi:hypothetical protein